MDTAYLPMDSKIILLGIFSENIKKQHLIELCALVVGSISGCLSGREPVRLDMQKNISPAFLRSGLPYSQYDQKPCPAAVRHGVAMTMKGWEDALLIL
jgi:hypothetical protein